MIRQKSFENERPSVYLVPTPIGNLEEMSPRAIRILKTVDVIACEDTRTSGQLLKHFEIHNRLISYQNFNEESSAKGILQLLEQGKNVALISDAGYPLISDPGQVLVRTVTEKGYHVIPISGPNAMLNALVASGLIVQPFIFIGFLPSGNNDCIKKLNAYRHYPMTMVFYEAPHRIERMLKNCLEVLGNRQCCLAREITKMHEEFLRGTIEEVIAALDEVRGEMVVVISGDPAAEQPMYSFEDVRRMAEEAISSGMSAKDAVKEITEKTGLPKNQVYDLVHHRDEAGCA